MTTPTETPTPSAQDDIKNVLQDAVIQHARALLKYTSTETFALQVPNADLYIFAGPRTCIAEFIQREIAEPAASFGASSAITPEYKVAQQWRNAEARTRLDAAAIASQSQAAQPTAAYQRVREEFELAVKLGAQFCINSAILNVDALLAAHIAGTSQAPHQPTVNGLTNEQAFTDLQKEGAKAIEVLRAADWPMLANRLNSAILELEQRFPHLAHASQATKAQAEPTWNPLPTPEGSAFYAYHPTLVHADFNPWGVVEAAHNGEEVVGAVWNGVHDCWDTIPIEVELWKAISGPNLAAPVAKEAPAVLEGYVIVPVKPTTAMSKAGEIAWACTDGLDMKAIYAAMLAAAPVVPTTQQAAKAESEQAKIISIADELEAEAMNYEGDFADTVKGCAEALRDLAHVMPPFAAPASQRSAWTAVEDGLPEERVRVLGARAGFDYVTEVFYGGQSSIAGSSQKTWRMNDHSFREPAIEGITHWMPLPSAPEQPGAAGSAKGGITNTESSGVAPTTSTVSAPAEQAYDLGEDRIDNALANFLAEHTNLNQDGIDTYAITMAWAINHAALKPVDASDIQEWCEQGYLTTPGSTEGAQAAEEVRNQALEEAAGVCKPGLIQGATAYEIAAIRKCADSILALRTTSTDQANADTDPPRDCLHDYQVSNVTTGRQNYTLCGHEWPGFTSTYTGSGA